MLEEAAGSSGSHADESMIMVVRNALDICVTWDPAVCGDYPLYFSGNRHDAAKVGLEEQQQREWLDNSNQADSVAVLVAIDDLQLKGYDTYASVEALLLAAARPVRLIWRRVKSQSPNHLAVQPNKLRVEVWDHDLVGSGDFLGQATIICSPSISIDSNSDSGIDAVKPGRILRQQSGLTRLGIKKSHRTLLRQDRGEMTSNDYGLLGILGRHVLPLVGRPGHNPAKEKFVKEGSTVTVNCEMVTQLQIHVLRANDLPKSDKNAMFKPVAGDPYVKVLWGYSDQLQAVKNTRHEKRTKVIKKDQNPVWGIAAREGEGSAVSNPKSSEIFHVTVSLEALDFMPVLRFELYDDDGMMQTDDFLGLVELKGERLLNAMRKGKGGPGVPFEQTFELLPDFDKAAKKKNYNKHLECVEAKGLAAADAAIVGGKSDPYCKIFWNVNGNDFMLHRTKYIKSELNPSWADDPQKYSSKTFLPFGDLAVGRKQQPQAGRERNNGSDNSGIHPPLGPVSRELRSSTVMVVGPVRPCSDPEDENDKFLSPSAPPSDMDCVSSSPRERSSSTSSPQQRAKAFALLNSRMSSGGGYNEGNITGKEEEEEAGNEKQQQYHLDEKEYVIVDDSGGETISTITDIHIYVVRDMLRSLRERVMGGDESQEAATQWERLGELHDLHPHRHLTDEEAEGLWRQQNPDGTAVEQWNQLDDRISLEPTRDTSPKMRRASMKVAGLIGGSAKEWESSLNALSSGKAQKKSDGAPVQAQLQIFLALDKDLGIVSYLFNQLRNSREEVEQLKRELALYKK